MKPEPRDDTLLVGVGNTLREDDGVGIHLLRRLKDYYSTSLNCMEITEPDISLAGEIAAYENLLVIDALSEAVPEPYLLSPLETVNVSSLGGFTSHLFSWGEILYTAAEVFGRAPKAELLGISAYNFGISEGISAPCKRNADAALEFLVKYFLK